MLDENGNFLGFSEPTWTGVPNELFDYCPARTTGNEFKVLMYIARWTCGYHREEAAISKDQMVNGYVTKGGRRLDYGAGVSERSIRGTHKTKNGRTPDVLDRLEEKRFITRVRPRDNGATLYRLNVLSGSDLSAVSCISGVKRRETQDVVPARLHPPNGGVQVCTPASLHPPIIEKETKVCSSGSKPPPGNLSGLHPWNRINVLDLVNPTPHFPLDHGSKENLLNISGQFWILNRALEIHGARKSGDGEKTGKPVYNDIRFIKGIIRSIRRDLKDCNPLLLKPKRTNPLPCELRLLMKGRPNGKGPDTRRSDHVPDTGATSAGAKWAFTHLWEKVVIGEISEEEAKTKFEKWRLPGDFGAQKSALYTKELEPAGQNTGKPRGEL